MNIGRIIPGHRGLSRRVLIGVVAVLTMAGPGVAGDGVSETAGASTTASAGPRADDRPLGLPAAPRRGAAPQNSREEPLAAEVRSSGVGVGRVAGALGFVLALILLVFKAIRGGARARGGLIAAAGPGGRAPSGVLSVLGRYPLGRGQTLLLMKLDRRVLLVAQTVGSRAGPSLATLAEIVDPEEAASIAAKCEQASPEAGRFRAELNRYDDEHRSAEAGHPGSATAVSSMRDRLAAWRRACPEGGRA